MTRYNLNAERGTGPTPKMAYWVKNHTPKSVVAECKAHAQHFADKGGMPKEVMYSLLDSMATYISEAKMSCNQLFRMVLPPHEDCQGCVDVLMASRVKEAKYRAAHKQEITRKRKAQRRADKEHRASKR